MGTALITGASTGIGAVYADRLAKRGFDLVLVSSDHDKLTAVAHSLRQHTEMDVRVMAADLTEPYDLACVEDFFVPILVLRCWSTMRVSAPRIRCSKARLTRWEALIELNVTALMRLTYAVVPAFVRRGAGTVSTSHPSLRSLLKF